MHSQSFPEMSIPHNTNEVGNEKEMCQTEAIIPSQSKTTERGSIRCNKKNDALLYHLVLFRSLVKIISTSIALTNVIVHYINYHGASLLLY